MTEEQQSQALAAWLAGPLGAPPPAGLDPDVVDAVLALRPERAPPMRASVTDVLGALDAGPLAAPAPILPLRRLRPFVGALGAVAAALLAWVVVVPGADRSPPALEEATQERSEAPTPAAAPRPFEQGRTEADAPTVVAQEPAASPAREDAARLDVPAGAGRGGLGGPPRTRGVELEGGGGSGGVVGGVVGGVSGGVIDGLGAPGYGAAPLADVPTTAAASSAPPSPPTVASPLGGAVAERSSAGEAASATVAQRAEAKREVRGPSRPAAAPASRDEASEKSMKPAEEAEDADVDWTSALAQIRAPEAQGQAIALAVARRAWAAGARDVAAAAVARGLALGATPSSTRDALLAAQRRIAAGQAP